MDRAKAMELFLVLDQKYKYLNDMVYAEGALLHWDEEKLEKRRESVKNDILELLQVVLTKEVTDVA